MLLVLNDVYKKYKSTIPSVHITQLVKHKTNNLKLPSSTLHGPIISLCSTTCFRYIKIVASALNYKEKRFMNSKTFIFEWKARAFHVDISHYY